MARRPERFAKLGPMPGTISVAEFERLATWMDEHGLDGGRIEDVEELAGGTQNIMLRFRRGDRTYVLRRGPTHLRPTSNDTIRREIRVLGGLAGTDVPHPNLIAGCVGEDVLDGAAFYLMESIDGFNASVGLPALHAHDAAIRHEMGLAAVDSLATLGDVDATAVGLHDLGKPDGFLDRQVTRWLDHLTTYERLEGYSGPAIPHLDDVSAWLRTNQPAEFRPGLSHGDYHLANLLFRHDGPQVAAIVDWEMCTHGDPLLDFGWLLATWPDETGLRSPGTIGGALADAGSLPTREELIERYAAVGSRPVDHADYYEVLACFKLGIVLEGTHARACAGMAPVEFGDQLHATTIALFERATSRLTATT